MDNERTGERATGRTGATDLSALASDLGTTREILRAWARRQGLLPAGGRPGVALRLSESEANALRAAWARERADDLGERVRTGGTERAHEQVAPGRTGERADRAESPEVERAGTDSAKGRESAGWQEALAESRARIAELVAERDTMRSERDVERVEKQAALSRADETERGRGVFVEMLAHERAAWWQWVSYLKGLSLLRRLRGIPEPPEELRQAMKRLAPPQG